MSFYVGQKVLVTGHVKHDDGNDLHGTTGRVWAVIPELTKFPVAVQLDGGSGTVWAFAENELRPDGAS